MARALSRGWLALALGALLVALAPAVGPLGLARRAAADPAVPVADVAVVSGIRVVHVAGTPREMGVALGRALGPEIDLLYRRYLCLFVPLPSERAALTAQARSMLKYIPEDYREEMEGLAAGSGLAFDQILFANCFLDLKRAPLCSTFTAAGPATADGGLIFGRNLDFPSLGVAHEHSLVTVYRPTGKKPFLTLGWPGFVGALSGMNADGLALAVMNVFLEEETPEGTPYTLLFRQILETCSTTDEAIALMRAARRTVGNNLMVCDPRPSSALIEFSAVKCDVRRPVDDLLYATNHFRVGPSLSKATCWRYPILKRELARRRGALDVVGAQEVLAAVGQWKLNIQAMVFRPQERDLWAAFGEPPASKRPYVHLPAELLWGPAPAPPAARQHGKLSEPL
ncbi:MAG: hypothetical protein HZA54_17800 [Planctomycetes bacterium]|nr:hypothetical protein [Planctomycetota bacterium]